MWRFGKKCGGEISMFCVGKYKGFAIRLGTDKHNITFNSMRFSVFFPAEQPQYV